MQEGYLKDIKQLFSDNGRTVLRIQENRRRRIMLVGGSLVGNDRSEERGVSALVSQNGVSGFAAASGVSRENACKVLNTAGMNADFLSLRTNKKGAAYFRTDGGVILPRRGITDYEQKRFIEACREIDAYTAEHCPGLTGRTVVYSEDSMEKLIYTSHANDGHAVYPRCYIMVRLAAESASGVPVELFRTFGGVGSFEDRFTDLSWVKSGVDKLYKMVMDKREGVFADAGEKTVVLGGMMSGMLAHEAVGHTVEADLVKGGSVAGKLLGRQAASELVSLTDYAAQIPGGEAPLPVYIDDEGTAAKDVPLIVNGILTGFMHSCDSAAEWGTVPCGNARGWSFSDEPLIRMRNTGIHPGRDKLEDMIASVDDGYYLLESGDGQADLTGEFMFGVNMGYEIKNGKLGRALLDTTVSGTAFDMLKSVDMISDRVTWVSSGFCGKKQPMPVGMGGPALRCRMNIGGR